MSEKTIASPGPGAARRRSSLRLRPDMNRDTAVTLSSATAADPLLSYAVSTNPLPLQVGTTGAITVVVSNPGGYSDQPAQDYVAVTSITFDFGPKGADAVNLTTVDGSSLTVTPPAGWGAPVVVGLQFVFTPPTAGGNVFPQQGLTFIIASIPVNQAVGTVPLTITEVASSPGDPTEPDLYPPQPSVSRQLVKGIGKFPANFTVSDLVARPPNVPVGSGPTLSWNGTAGAAYELDFGTANITQHKNKTLLQATDIYPNAAAGDAPLSLTSPTVFTLTVSYTPPGGTTPAVLVRQVTVGVNYPSPTITAFSINPPWVFPGPSGTVNVSLIWASQQGAGDGPVTFLLDPPLSAAELAANPGNNFFNTVHTASGQTSFNFCQGHRVTMVVAGPPGTQPAQQVLDVLSFPTSFNYTANVAVPLEIQYTPDGRYAFLLNEAPDQSYPALAVIQMGSGPDPSTWVSTPLFTHSNIMGLAVTPDGNYLLLAFMDKMLVLTIDATKDPAAWTMTTIENSPAAVPQDVAVTPDGRYAFCAGLFALYLIEIPPGQPPSSWTMQSIRPNFFFSLVVSPDGRYLFGVNEAILQPQNRGVMVLEITEGAPPEQWAMAIIPNPDVAIVCTSRDGRYLFTQEAPGNVGVIDTSLSPRPAEWTIARLLTLGAGTPGVCVAADNQFAFAATGGPMSMDNGTLTVFRLDPTQPTNTWASLGLGGLTSFMPFASATPDGRFILVPNAGYALTVYAPTPVLSALPQ